MINAVLTNEILNYITEIDKNRYAVSSVRLPKSVANKLRKNSKKKSSEITSSRAIVTILKGKSSNCHDKKNVTNIKKNKKKILSQRLQMNLP